MIFTDHNASRLWTLCPLTKIKGQVSPRLIADSCGCRAFSCKPPYSRDRRRRSPFFKLHGSGKGGKQKDLLTGREPIRMITRQSNHQSTVSSSRRTYLLQKNAMKSIQHRFSVIGFAEPFPAKRKNPQRSRKKGAF